MNRAERRRREREKVKKGPAAQVTDFGFGAIGEMVNTGEYEQAISAIAQLPDKEPGKHRWVLLCSYTVTEAAVRSEMSDGGPTYFDHENRFGTSLGCIDCEEQYPLIDPDTVCPASGYEE